MMFVSILLKTYGAVLLGHAPVLGAVLWIASLAADYGWVRRAGGSPGSRLASVIVVQAGSILAGVAVYVVHFEAAMRWKDGVAPAAQAAALVLRALGFSAAALDGVVHATTMAGILQLPVDLDRLALLSPLWFAVFSVVALLAVSPGAASLWRGLAWIAGVVTGAAIFRWVLATILFLFASDFVSYETEELPVLPFFKPGLAAALYLPFLLVGAVLLQKRLGGLRIPVEGDARRIVPWKPWLSGLVLVLLMVVLWEPSGTPKEGEVLINNYHAQWSRTDRPYDRDWYGAAAGYNYACMKRLFEHFYPTRELKTRITPEELAKAAVLVLYDPDRAFTADEIRAIRAFVERGGGIFLVGDHTNVFGTTSHLNSVCRPFGLIFRDDVLFDLDEDFFQLYDVPRTASQFLHGTDFFKFRGPASIQATSWFTRTIFPVRNAKSLRAIYSVNNFYPPPHDNPKMRIGTFSCSTASRFGRGRVLAFADSTIFSNFEIFYPGKYEYLLNGMRWLHRADRPLTTPVKRMALLGAIAVLALQLVRSRTPRRILGTGMAGIVAAAVAWAVCLAAEQARAGFPRPARPTDLLFFVMDQDDEPYTLRTFVTDASYDQKYDVFIQWVLRSNIFSGFYLHGPEHGNALYEALADEDEVRAGLALIVSGPEHLAILEELGPERLATADPLLLMVSGSTNLTQEAVMASIRNAEIFEDPAHLAEAEGAWPAGDLRIEDGERRVAVIFAAEQYSDLQMGFSEKVDPSETQRALYEKQFELMDWLYRRDEEIEVQDEGVAK